MVAWGPAWTNICVHRERIRWEAVTGERNAALSPVAFNSMICRYPNLYPTPRRPRLWCSSVSRAKEQKVAPVRKADARYLLGVIHNKIKWVEKSVDGLEKDITVPLRVPARVLSCCGNITEDGRRWDSSRTSLANRTSAEQPVG